MNESICASCRLASVLFAGLFLGQAALAREPEPQALELVRALELRETAEPIRSHRRWANPKKIAVAFRGGLGFEEKEFLDGVQSVAGGAEVVLFDYSESAIGSIADADVFIGFCSPRIVDALPNLRWMHTYTVGVERCLAHPAVRERDFILSNNQRVSGPSIAELAIAMTMVLSKNLHYYQQQQSERLWSQDVAVANDLAGQTMLILGLGGIGTETARRASALGMRVIATRNTSRTGPEFVDKVGLSSDMYALAAEADVVVNALPLTAETNGLIDRRFFAALKRGAIYVSVGRGRTTVTDDLLAALQDGTLSSAGLDVTDPEPLPTDHPLWSARNVLITPHVAGQNADSFERTLVVAKENLRRYVLGDKLLNVVDVERGY